MNASDVKSKLSTPGGRAGALVEVQRARDREGACDLPGRLLARAERRGVEGGRGVYRQGRGLTREASRSIPPGRSARPTKTCSGRSSTPKNTSISTNIMRKQTRARFAAGMMGFWLGAVSLAQEVGLLAPRLLTLLPMGASRDQLRGHDHGREHRRGGRVALLPSRDHRETARPPKQERPRPTPSSSPSPPMLPRACMTPGSLSRLGVSSRGPSR